MLILGIKALARAVYSKRKIIFIDDAFSGMDAHTVEAVSLQLFGKNGILRKLQATVIMTTHNRKPSNVLIIPTQRCTKCKGQRKL